MRQVLGQTLRRWPAGYRALNRLRGFRLHEPDTALPTKVLGSDYGAWGVDLSALGAQSVVYSVGVGEDISFDLALLDCTGCTVFAFDPTPSAIAWLEGRPLPAGFHFHPLGLAARDGDLEFHKPRTAGGASFSLQGEEGNGGTVQCPVRRVASLMALLGHERLDLLKMDIEGAEYEVVEDLLASGVRPRFLLVEFHHGLYGIEPARTEAAVTALREAGYGIYWVSDLGREYGFVDQR